MTRSQIFPAVHNPTKTIAFYHRTTVSLFPFQTKIDQHPISSCIITNELHCKVSRIKKRSRKRIENRMENMHTEVTVYRVKLTCDFNLLCALFWVVSSLNPFSIFFVTVRDVCNLIKHHSK